jgi:uncharacterized membrane protein
MRKKISSSKSPMSLSISANEPSSNTTSPIETSPAETETAADVATLRSKITLQLHRAIDDLAQAQDPIDFKAPYERARIASLIAGTALRLESGATAEPEDENEEATLDISPGLKATINTIREAKGLPLLE